MLTKNHIPLILPLFGFIVGVIVADRLAIDFKFPLTFLAAAVMVSIINVNQQIKSLLLIFAFFFAGWLSFIINDHSLSTQHYSNKQSENLEVTIRKKDKTKKGYRYFAKVHFILNQELRIPSKGKLIIYTDSSIVLNQYDSYKISSDFRTIKRYQNPEKFDYGTFLAYQNIYFSSYLNSEPELTSEAGFFYKFLRETHLKALDFFDNQLADENAAALLNTILLGAKKSMDSDLRQTFINNGLAHLLAISGMHVGIVLLILRFLFRSIPIAQVKALLIIIGIWLYILLSGLQIPAIRAGFMFTVYLIGHHSSRNVKSLNSVLFAALILLGFEPKLLFQLSFQLSFSAMISILLFYQPIYNLFAFSNVLLRNLWQLIALNFSVQLLILPLSIYYFKQLPTYSIISSIISMPFIVFFMWAGFFMLVFAKCSIIIDKVGLIVETVVAFYIDLIEKISQLPFALIENLELHSLQIFFWTAGIILSFHFQQQKRSAYVFASFVPLIVISSVLNIIKQEQRELIIYDTERQIIVDIIDHGNHFRFKEKLDEFSFQVEYNQPSNSHLKLLQDLQDYNGLKIGLYSAIVRQAQPIRYDICILDQKINAILDLENCAQFVIPRNYNIDNTDPLHYNIESLGAFKLKF